MSAYAGTVMVILLLGAIVGLIIHKMLVDKKKGKSACGCSCGCCPNAPICRTQTKERS